MKSMYMYQNCKTQSALTFYSYSARIRIRHDLQYNILAIHFILFLNCTNYTQANLLSFLDHYQISVPGFFVPCMCIKSFDNSNSHDMIQLKFQQSHSHTPRTLPGMLTEEKGLGTLTLGWFAHHAHSLIYTNLFYANSHMIVGLENKESAPTSPESFSFLARVVGSRIKTIYIPISLWALFSHYNNNN